MQRTDTHDLGISARPVIPRRSQSGLQLTMPPQPTTTNSSSPEATPASSPAESTIQQPVVAAAAVTVVHQNMRVRDLDPFATIMTMAARAFVPDSKLAILPPQITLQRQTEVGRVVRTVCSYFTNGFSQDDYHLLHAPTAKAVEAYLRASTLTVFELATIGLRSLRDCYSGNTALALGMLIAVLETGMATHGTSTAPFTESPIWSACEVETVSAIFCTIKRLAESQRMPWVNSIELLLERKFAA